MPILLVSSLRALVGKTTVCVGLARRLSQDGRPVSLARLTAGEPDEAARSDARCFAFLSLSAQERDRPLSVDEVAQLAKEAGSLDSIFIAELPSGFGAAGLARTLGGSVVLVERFASLNVAEVSAIQKELAAGYVGLVLTAVPRARMAAIAHTLAEKGIPSLGLLPEDRLLSSPTIAEISAALKAETLFADSRAAGVIERLTIASISADPGQDYFARLDPQAVVVRWDKPDLQLAALNAHSRCLILTGGRMPLAYVSERAEAESVPLLITGKGTVAALQALEELYFTSRFGHQKAERISQLMAECLDYDRLVGTQGPGQRGSSGG